MTPPRITIELDQQATAGTDLALVLDHDHEARLIPAAQWSAWRGRTTMKLVGLIRAIHEAGATLDHVTRRTTRHLQDAHVLVMDECAVLRMTSAGRARLATMAGLSATA